MITQIELDGFKTFKDFKVELAPFQVIVGPNGAGKSNLFDALHLLSRLAEVDLQTAFQPPRDDPQKPRGDAYELFTLLPNGERVEQMRLAVEMLVDQKVQDDLGGEYKLIYRRLRYELVITLRGNQFGLKHEALKSITLDKDNWLGKYVLSPKDNLLSLSGVANIQKAFIDTDHPKPIRSNKLTILLRSTTSIYSDGKEGGRSFSVYKARRTGLSSVIDTTFPHAFAVREELRSLRLLHLNPDALRQPSSINASPFLLPDGSNLPTTLARMQTEDKFALNDVSLDLANLVPDLVEVELRTDDSRNEYTIWAKYMDGRSYSSRVLSDGTLRLLALTTLRNDPQFHGVLCLEEPENGVHPSYFTNIARLLRRLATDFADPQQVDEPPRQVLITTHSPTFITQPDVIDALLFMYTMTRVEPLASGVPPMSFTHAAPVLVSGTQSSQLDHLDIDRREASYTIDMVKDLLIQNQPDEAIERLNASRITVNEGSM